MEGLINYKGTIILESLKTDDVIKHLTITSKEVWNVDNNNIYQPNIWTAISFENSDEKIEIVLETIKSNLKTFWYVDISDESKKYIIYPGKIISYYLNDKNGMQEAIDYGKSIGIPDSQLDWS